MLLLYIFFYSQLERPLSGAAPARGAGASGSARKTPINFIIANWSARYRARAGAPRRREWRRTKSRRKPATRRAGAESGPRRRGIANTPAQDRFRAGAGRFRAVTARRASRRLTILLILEDTNEFENELDDS